MLIDLERRFRPRLYPFFFPPIVLWVHVIVHLVGAQGPHGGMTTHSVYLLCITRQVLQSSNSHDDAKACAQCQCEASHKHQTDTGQSTATHGREVLGQSFVHGPQYQLKREQDCCCCLCSCMHAACNSQVCVCLTDHLSGPCLCLSRHRLPLQPCHLPACLHSSNQSCPKSHLKLQYI